MALAHVGATLGLGEKAGSTSLRISEKKHTECSPVFCGPLSF